MRYGWVNQNQTYRHEVRGGYLWSPKRRSNGGMNPYYETMREVAPGDWSVVQRERVKSPPGVFGAHRVRMGSPPTRL
jgi:putative restriction endonuclease